MRVRGEKEKRREEGRGVTGRQVGGRKEEGERGRLSPSPDPRGGAETRVLRRTQSVGGGVSLGELREEEE